MTGTTGWLPELETFQAEVLAANGRFMYSGKTSVGVNVLFQLNKMLAKLMNGHPQYDCYIEEAHHRHKKDAPSGTAQSLAGQILDGLNHKTKLAGPELLLRAPEPEELSIAFTRAGEIIGNHQVASILILTELRFSTRHSTVGDLRWVQSLLPNGCKANAAFSNWGKFSKQFSLSENL